MTAVDPGPLALGDFVAGCTVTCSLGGGDGIWRYAATERELDRSCELVAIDLTRPAGATALARARTLAAHALTGIQIVHRLHVAEDRAVLVVQSDGGVPLVDAVRDQPLRDALGYIDQLLATLAAARHRGLAPADVTAAVVADARAIVPCAVAVAAANPDALRAALCEVFAAVAARPDVPAAVLAALEAFDRDLFDEVHALRAALARAQVSWWQRRRRTVLGAAALAMLAATATVVHAWRAPPSIDYVIVDDLAARVVQMELLARTSTVVPHGRGPDLSGVWIDEGAPTGLPMTLTRIGDDADGKWFYDRQTTPYVPGAAGSWRHAGVLTLRELRGRRFLTGNLDRTPHIAADDSFATVEIEVRDADHMQLRSSVFHDAGGVGWSFAYFDLPIARAR